ncbi:OPT oligopeptide transporter protein-domain-containing protein [Russula emetica]|nr:OPT oligopeptide transporter protein-domain-containing protein [Russula emetica]
MVLGLLSTRVVPSAVEVGCTGMPSQHRRKLIPELEDERDNYHETIRSKHANVTIRGAEVVNKGRWEREVFDHVKLIYILNRGPHYLLVGGMSIYTFQSLVWLLIGHPVLYDFGFPCLQVEPDHTTSCACSESSQPPATGQPYEEKRSTEIDNHTTDHQSDDAMDTTVDDNDDPNFDPTAPALEDESPYPEVRSAVANTDDPTMPTSTFRAWVIGLIWAVLRYPYVSIDQFVPMLLSLPIGKAWARYLPNISFFGIPLNPGPFTIKEHVIITIMAGVGAGPAYAIEIIAVQKVYYNQHPPFAYQWLLVMSTQLIGFSIAGIYKRFVVIPPSMIWPENLLTAVLFNALHGQKTLGTQACGGISRLRFFYYVFIGYIFYNFLPSYLFTALSSFSWVCWIAPNNAKVNQLFGVSHGLAMGLLTFDWGQIAFNTSPFPTPWWAAANIGITVAFFYWFLVPILYYTNIWYSAYLPLVSSDTFDNTGKQYNVSQIINSDSSFNLQAYKSYSPIFLSASLAISYGLSFATITATLTHTFLYYRKYIWTHARRPLSEQPDIHAHLMSVYKEVPSWWYLTIFVTMFVFGVVVIEVWETDLPVWGFVLALLISFVYTLPLSVIRATTGLQITLNVITELIIGYALPGRPIAIMLFKTWGFIAMTQALDFTSDFKLAHYMKIAHRPMFFCQVVATIVAGTVQLGVQAWMFSNIEDLCDADQKDGFICLPTTAFGNASILWGVIGPRRLYSHGQLYYGLVFFFLVGILAPLFQWTLHKKFRIDFLKYINLPVAFDNAASIPPLTPLNFMPWVFVCFIFNYVIRRRHFDWWAKYNCYTIGLLIIFFALQYPKNGTIGLNSIQKWWGEFPLRAFQKEECSSRSELESNCLLCHFTYIKRQQFLQVYYASPQRGLMLKADKYIKPQRQSAKYTAKLGHAKPHLHSRVYISPFVYVERNPVRVHGSSSRHTWNPFSTSTF